MEVNLKQLDPEKDIKELSILAKKIWNDYYPEIICQEQIDYMLGQSYSDEALRKQMLEDKHVFTGAFINGKMEGYISVSGTGPGEYFIHKLYVNMALHKRGIGRALFENFLKNKDIASVRLTVNRQNYKAVNFYFRMGFVIEKVIDIEIGNGFEMNDFVMIYKPGNLN